MIFKRLLFLITAFSTFANSLTISKTIKMDSLHVSMDSAYALYSGVGGALSLVGSSTPGAPMDSFTFDQNEGDKLFLLVWNPGLPPGTVDFDSVAAAFAASVAPDESSDPIYRMDIPGDAAAVPEPKGLVLMGLGLIGLAGMRWVTNRTAL